MNLTIWKSGLAAIAVAAFGAGLLRGADPAPLSGSLAGVVSSASGIPQMGATVLLFNQYDRLIQRALTTERGAFGFDHLVPGFYTVRISLASFLPASKSNILVRAGIRQFLAISLNNVLSSIELVYSAPGQGTLMSDDWKWVLRSSMATRPVLRIRGNADPWPRSVTTSAFSDMRGVVRVSAGDSAAPSSLGAQSDLGTAFAFATSVFGVNQIQVAGNLGYGSHLGTPTAGIRTRYSRGPENTSAELQLTMRQAFVPGQVGASIVSGQKAGVPGLRTLSATFLDRARIGDSLELKYGASMDSVQFLDRLNYVSPFALLSYAAGALGVIEAAFSSGVPPAELYAGAGSRDMQSDLTALALFPRLSMRAGRPALERSENFELGFRKVAGSRTIAAGAYRARVSNAALTAAAPAGLYSLGDLLPDLFSNSSVFNIGNYSATGLTASITQKLTEGASLGLAYGNGTTLRTEDRQLETANPNELRSAIRASRRHWLMARASGTIPLVGTRFAASYQWTDYRALTPGHAYLTQSLRPEAGLNVQVRQPLPAFSGMPGRLEANAELRNLLEQGYLPVSTADSRKMLLIHSPRAVRGGLSFIF